MRFPLVFDGAEGRKLSGFCLILVMVMPPSPVDTCDFFPSLPWIGLRSGEYSCKQIKSGYIENALVTKVYITGKVSYGRLTKTLSCV